MRLLRLVQRAAHLLFTVEVLRGLTWLAQWPSGLLHYHGLCCLRASPETGVGRTELGPDDGRVEGKGIRCPSRQYSSGCVINRCYTICFMLLFCFYSFSYLHALLICLKFMRSTHENCLCRVITCALAIDALPHHIQGVMAENLRRRRNLLTPVVRLWHLRTHVNGLNIGHNHIHSPIPPGYDTLDLYHLIPELLPVSGKYFRP